ncbi:tape measure protein [Aquamicrobium zhengzhouense]|uniref:Lysozyme n=1 Tax=Aquamicrobium zhengzhouense TaxID=2781738 RepID=A0ABS0SBD8_9HYPH|nr:tape measure protein [Aquamicrobium zhengzhouense]MBI1620021.1 tape measure protein [Aquamicrobium zhengzhouense]
MARKDIEVRIKARDEASRNAKKVADALKQLSTTGNNLGTTGTKVGGAMSAIGDGLGKLQGKLGGIDNLGKLVTELNKTTSVVDRLEKELSDSKRVLEEQSQKTRAAAQTSAELKARLEAETAAQKQRSDRLKELTNTRNKDTKSVLDAARAAEKLQSIIDTGKGGFSGPRYQRKGVGIEAGAPFKSARESFGAFLQPEIEAGLGGKAALTAEVNALKAANDASKTSISALRGEIKAASAEERQFAADTEKAADQVTKLNEKVLAATGTWSKLDDEATKASKELGGIAISQEAVAAATAKAEDELRKQAATLAAYERLAAKKLVGGGTIGDPTQRDQARAQADALRQAREEVKLLRDEQARLDAAMRSGSGNVSAQVDAYDRMTRAVKLAEEQVRKLEIQQRLAQNTGASGFAKWAKVYNPITTGAEAAVQSQERLNQSTRRTVAEAGKIAPMAQRNTGALRNQSAATDKASTSIVKLGRDTRTTLSFMQRMRGELLAMTSGFLGFYAAINRGQQAMEAFMNVQKAENRLGVAFQGDTQKVAREIGFLNEQADRLGFTFGTLADGYGKISIAASNAGFAVADTRELFLSVAEAARVNGSSMDEMNGVLRALDQMLSKGKIQAEELRGQLGDRMSGAFKMFADGLGMTTAQLDEAMKKGEVYADRETMLKFARRLQQAYGSQVPKAMQTLAASLGTFERDMEKANVAMAEGFVPALQEALKAFNEFANSAEGQATFRGIGEAAGSVISVLALIPQNLDLIVFGLKAIAAVGVARVFASLVGTLKTTANDFMTFSANAATATAATTRFGAAQLRATGMIRQTAFALTFYEARLRGSTSSTALARAGTLGLATTIGALRTVMLTTAGAARALWLAVGGPIGAAVLAISAVIAGWGSNADAATKALDTHEKHLQAVRTAYAEVGEGVDNWADKIKGLTLLDAMNTADELEKLYLESIRSIESAATRLQRMLNRQLAITGDFGAGSYRDELTALNELINGFIEGSVEVKALKDGLSDLALNAESEGIRQWAKELNDLVNATDASGKSVVDYADGMKKAQAIMRVLNGTATEADKVLLGLAKAVDEVNTSVGKNKLIEAYGEALDELKSKIPSLTEEMKKLKDITDLNAAAWKALTAAWKTGDFSKIGEVLKLWGQGGYDLAQKNALGIFDGSSGAGGGTAALIKKFEGFRSEPYWDVNAYRAGYGSDTVTLADGSIQKVVQGITVSRADAERDLARRIVEFQNTVKSQIGEGRFSAFDDKQQAVLTSIAYNYGSLPERILDAVRNGSAEEISNAIMRLSGDNGGVNAERRTQEAMIFSAGGDANIGTMVEAEQERLKLLNEQNEATKKRIADLDHQIAQQGLINNGKEREAAIEDAIRAAKAENPNLNEQEIQAIRDRTAALWEQQNVNREIELQEERINQLQSLRQALMEQMDQARAAGDQGQLTALQTELDGVNQRLQEAIANGIKMWEAVGGVEAEAKIANLKTMQGAISASKQEFGLFGLSMQTWQGVFDSAVNGLVGAFDAMAQAIANGENAFEAFGKAVLQTLAQVLQQIAVAIIRMQILKMLQGFGGSIGGFATAALGGMTGHTGGIVGSMAIGTGNSIRSAGWVQSALTYHTGGIAGLRPDEVSATLKKGEEILTEEDPRHRNNLGGESTGSQGTRLTQVLAIGDNEIANAMKGKSGQDVTLTHIKSNAPTIKRMLGL